MKSQDEDNEDMEEEKKGVERILDPAVLLIQVKNNEK